MNRKNLTAAVLAGLAGAAGLAGTAQAVNLNPDGLGQVLVYPFYTSNNGSQTILSVVNTTDHAKAVKVRFLEGYNSREVLDFNLYLSHHDVWVASITKPAVSVGGAGPTTLIVPDTSCTVPYLYGDGVADGLEYGMQEFLPYAYTGDYEDGGPTDIARASVGHFEMIEMGRLTNDSARAKTELLPKRVGSATAATHVVAEDGSEVPYDCDQLVRNWTIYGSAGPDDPMDGMWAEEALSSSDDQAWTDTHRNTGGLFGGAAVVNVANGTMFSYDAKAIQGFDKTDDGMHAYPGTKEPSLDTGNQHTATVFFGTPSNQAVDLFYHRSVEAVSAVFMHDHVMNEFNTETVLAAQTDWVLTFPTKSFYVDSDITGTTSEWIPDVNDEIGCHGWEPGDWFPPGDKDGVIDPEAYPEWATCDYVKVTFGNIVPPFTSSFNGKACETVFYSDWNREESPFITPGTPNIPPIVSPPPPGPPKPGKPPAFQLCYETNILEFVGEDTDPVFPAEGLVATVEGAPASGWATIDMSLIADKDHDFPFIELHQDSQGLVGLPVTGFGAQEYVNEFLTGGVIAHYGGLFQHKASVKRIAPECAYHFGDEYCD
ncbi:MAG: hypothetical protein GWP58_10520 [Gammaproteobacteria bacterium]|jgi:hypothetical protein|nr:hypothetical protein [Gammaproteobacteria bacterium]